MCFSLDLSATTCFRGPKNPTSKNPPHDAIAAKAPGFSCSKLTWKAQGLEKIVHLNPNPPFLGYPNVDVPGLNYVTSWNPKCFVALLLPSIFMSCLLAFSWLPKKKNATSSLWDTKWQVLHLINGSVFASREGFFPTAPCMSSSEFRQHEPPLTPKCCFKKESSTSDTYIVNSIQFSRFLKHVHQHAVDKCHCWNN